MFHVITGGSGSGKSEYAEQTIMEYMRNTSKEEGTDQKLYYIATMMPFGEETKKKIARHRRMRAGKGFQTIECYTDLREHLEPVISGTCESHLLLECMSNLTANELYAEEGAKEKAAEIILEGISFLRERCRSLVVVTNEVFSESGEDSEEMKHYKKVLGTVNVQMAEMADRVTEVVYGIPVEVKGCR